MDKKNTYPRPNKALGQHFLKDDTISQQIVAAIPPSSPGELVVEIGPGTGALTQWLVPLYNKQLHLIEVDQQLAAALQQRYPMLQPQIHCIDALQVFWSQLFPKKSLQIIGNLPYNIASPLFFKFIEARTQIRTMVCMIQHEVAQRLTAAPGSKIYGIPSVWVQSFYSAEYLFKVPPGAFFPPPKVDSGVIRLIRHDKLSMPCTPHHLLQVLKMSFHQRRKTLRNALRKLIPTDMLQDPILQRRAETLSVQEFWSLTQRLFATEASA